MTDLADRYGTTGSSARRRRVVVIALAALVAVAFLGWLAWAAVVHARPAVASELQGFEIGSTHEAVARVQVQRRDGDVRASCRVRAIAADHSIVGEQTFTPEGAADAVVEVTIRTEREATSVDLLGCTAAGQNRPR